MSNPIEDQARGIMLMIERRIGPVESQWANDRAQQIYGAVLERCEIARDALKEESYDD